LLYMSPLPHYHAHDKSKMSSSTTTATLDDDRRHREEQEMLRRKRKAAKDKKSESAREKERKRREHAQKVLAKHGGISTKSSSSSSKLMKTPEKDYTSDKPTSAFQALFEKRAEGFLVDFKFRNAPPRPPVGPCFIGPGFEGEMKRSWTRYRSTSSIELNHKIELFDEKDIGTGVLASALDLDGCYPKSKIAMDTGVMLDPADEALLNWKGSFGDTGAEELQKRRDRAKALANAGDDAMAETPSKLSKIERAKKKKEGSRVLSEKNQRWMKKTTYLTNDQSRSVHHFKSQAEIKQSAKETVDNQMMAIKKMTGEEAVEKSFEAVNEGVRSQQHPSKRGVTVVFDAPFLPDAASWGHSYSNVVIDSLPKGVKPPTQEQLSHAMIADVERKEQQNQRMMCHLLVPADDRDSENLDGENASPYDVTQQYDLDVIPLNDDEDDSPDINFFFFFDEENQVVTYHPVQSRVQLSTGRLPREDVAPMDILREEMSPEDIYEYQSRAAEVDDELAEKIMEHHA